MYPIPWVGCPERIINSESRSGLEYSFRKMFMVRVGYVYEKDLFDEVLRSTALTGPTAGATFVAVLIAGAVAFNVPLLDPDNVFATFVSIALSSESFEVASTTFTCDTFALCPTSYA